MTKYDNKRLDINTYNSLQRIPFKHNNDLAGVEDFLNTMKSITLPSFFILGIVCRAVAQDFCNPSPCGKNTDCSVENGRPVCSCKPTYIGDPLSACVHECESDNDCSPDTACRNYRCKDPCTNGCGDFASCSVRNHKPICQCPSQFGGNAYVKCIPECSSQEECPANLACIDLHCGDPCLERRDLCKANTDCKVGNHQAICTCKKGYIGDPVGSGCFRARNTG